MILEVFISDISGADNAACTLLYRTEYLLCHWSWLSIFSIFVHSCVCFGIGPSYFFLNSKVSGADNAACILLYQTEYLLYHWSWLTRVEPIYALMRLLWY